MIRIALPTMIALAVFPCLAAGAADAVSPQGDVKLYQLDERLQRQACTPPATNPLPPEIVLDGSGRYLDLIATRSKPAYWSAVLPQIQIRNAPDRNPARDDEDSLEIRASDSFSVKVKPTERVIISRADLLPFERGGIVQLEVLRSGLVISSLWLILREYNVILIGDDGPLDPVYRSAIVPAYMKCDFQLEHVTTMSGPAPPLVLEAPAMQPPSNFQPIDLSVRPIANVDWTALEPLKREGRKDVQLVLIRNGRAAGVLWLTQEPRAGFRPIISPDSNSNTAASGATPATGPSTEPSTWVKVLLDRLGVASPAFLNRRRPAYIPPTSRKVFLEFTSVAPDRAFVVTFSGIPESERAELVLSGVQIGSCRDQKCKAALRVPPGGSASVPVGSLRNAYAQSGTGSTVTFDVAFYDDDNTPTNSRGYLTFVDEAYFTEPASSTTWTGALSVSLLNDPDLSGAVPSGRSSAVITSANPWNGMNRTHVSGSATIGIKQNMGNRADFEAELTAKNGDFGQDVPSVQSSKYLANVYTDYGATITGGRFDVAAPTNAIAISESGDAVNFGSRLGSFPAFASAGFVFRKELPMGSFNVAELQKAIQGGASSLDRSNRDLVLQLRDLTAGRVRAALYGVVGDADRGRLRVPVGADPTLEGFDANYWTAGGEGIVTMGNAFASLGLYRSGRSNTAPEGLRLAGDGANGDAELLSLSYTSVDPNKFQGNQRATGFSFTGQAGHGGSYVGENQAFTPDLLFLSRFAPALIDPEAPIGAGLANKWYYGLVATTQKLDWLSLGKGAATLKLHHYQRTEPRAGSRNLGTEASLEVRVEQPKGVRYQLTMAGFRPGGALNPSDASLKLITAFQYLFKFNVTVRIE